MAGVFAPVLAWAVPLLQRREPRSRQTDAAWISLAIAPCHVLWLWRRQQRLRDVEQARELAQRRLSAVVETGDELLWEMDATGRLIYLSPAISRYLGYKPVDLIGKHTDVLLPLWERDRVTQLLSEGVRRGSGWTNERVTFLTKDGVERLLVSSAVAHVAADGRVIGFTGTVRGPPGDEERRRRQRLVRDRIGDVINRAAVEPVFQPIMDIATGTTVGAEALSRFPDHRQGGPAQWFADAREVGLGEELELLALSKALDAARDLPQAPYVSVNLSPATVTGSELVPLLRAAELPLSRLVIEVTEHASVPDYRPLVERLAQLRALGVRVAVDDAGAGYASFRHILRLAPDIIKLDRDLVEGVDGDPARRALVSAVVTFARESGSTVVAEGIERPEELRVTARLGVAAGQGFLLGLPAAARELSMHQR